MFILSTFISIGPPPPRILATASPYVPRGAAGSPRTVAGPRKPAAGAASGAGGRAYARGGPLLLKSFSPLRRLAFGPYSTCKFGDTRRPRTRRVAPESERSSLRRLTMKKAIGINGAAFG